MESIDTEVLCYDLNTNKKCLYYMNIINCRDLKMNNNNMKVILKSKESDEIYTLFFNISLVNKVKNIFFNNLLYKNQKYKLFTGYGFNNEGNKLNKVFYRNVDYWDNQNKKALIKIIC